MPRLGGRRVQPSEDDEGYFISMSDMLTGLLFVFIILLLYFALQFRRTTEELTGANTARQQLLEELQQRLQKQGLQVEIDTVTGVLRLPDDILFQSGQNRLTTSGIEAVGKVADALAAVLPCYTDSDSSAGLECLAKPSPFRVDALFVEGHTDRQKYMRGSRDANIDLSTERAINTYLALVADQPKLEDLTSRQRVGSPAVPILSVSGYGPRRPISGYAGLSEEELRKNRRIDLRFLMVTPNAEDLANLQIVAQK